ALVYCCCPRLVILLVSVLLGLIFFILRLFLPHQVHWGLIICVPILNSLTVIFIYGAGFYQRADKEESFWKTLTKPDPKASCSVNIKYSISSASNTSTKMPRQQTKTSLKKSPH